MKNSRYYRLILSIILLFQSTLVRSDVTIPSGTKNQYNHTDYNRTNQYKVRSIYLGDTTANTMQVKAPELANDNYDWIFPSGDGTANQCLATDGTENLSWIDVLRPTATQTASNKTISSSTILSSTEIGDATDSTKQVAFDVSGATTAKTATLDFNHTDNRVISFPDSTTLLIGNDTLDNLTNKTIQAGRIDDYIDVNEETTPSTPSAGKVRLYAKNDKKLYTKDSNGSELPVGSGSGSGVKNFIDKGDAELGLTTGWATYADAAGLQPVNGTAGTSSLTLTANSTSPLDGIYDYKIAKGAVNEQGEGVSYDFTISKAITDSPRILTIDFDYRTTTNFDYGDAFNPATDPSDIVVYIYDRDNSRLIQPNGFALTNSGHFTATFQPQAGADDYRLIFHVAGVNATAWDFFFDNVLVTPQVSPRGPPSSDWAAYTPTFVNFGTVTNLEAFWRQNGDSIDITVNARAGTPGAGDATISLPSGLAINYDKIKTAAAADESAVVGRFSAQNDTDVVFAVVNENTDVNKIGFSLDTVAAGLEFRGATEILQTNDKFSIQINSLPITGWSSNTLLSSDANVGSAVAQMIATSGSHTSTGNWQKVALDTATFDKRAKFDNANDRWYVPVAGYYEIEASTGFAANATGSRYTAIYKNGVSISDSTPTLGHATNISIPSRPGTFELNVGDYIELYAYQDSGGNLSYSVGGDRTSLTIVKVSDPTTIAASLVVSAKYKSNAGQSIPNNAVEVIEFEDLVFDNHSGYNISTGVFTAPIPGYYLVTSRIAFVSTTTWAEMESAYIRVNKNSGSEYTYLDRRDQYGASNTQMVIGGTDLIQLNVGDTIKIEVAQSSGAALALDTDANINYISIVRQGGVM